MRIAVVNASGIVVEILNFLGDVITDAQSVSGESGVALSLPGTSVTFQSGFRYEAEAGTRFVVSNDAGIGWLWNENDTLVSPLVVLSDLKSARIADLTAACHAEILGGFDSAALGDLHSYPSQMTDQVNLMGSVTGSLLPDLPTDWSTPFWCADEAGVWAFRQHTALQIQQAGRDGKAHVVACQTALDSLSAAVLAAADIDAAAAIVWA